MSSQEVGDFGFQIGLQTPACRSIPTAVPLKKLDLKGQGHEIRMGQKLYGLMGLVQEMVRQLFNIFSTLPLIFC